LAGLLARERTEEARSGSGLIKTEGDKVKAVKVLMAAIMTACGRITPGGLGSALDRRHLEDLRLKTDAGLIGAETLREGDPEMRGPGGRLPEKRLRAVITRSGNLPVSGKKIFQVGPPPVVFTGRAQVPLLEKKLAGKARIMALPEGPGGLSVAAALSELGRLGAETVLIEGGARLNYAALAEGAVDEIFLTLAPKISGKTDTAALADGPDFLGRPFLPLELLECNPAETGEIFLRYRVVRELRGQA